MKYKKCPECEGKGKYEIHNAYDPDYRQEVPCEDCKGTGFKSELAKSALLYEASRWN